MESHTHDAAGYPVVLEVRMPERFEREQVLLRFLVCIGLAALHLSGGGPLGTLYLLLPIIASILISRRGGDGFIAEDGPWFISLLEWIVGLYAYLMFVTDRFPLDRRARLARMHVRPVGTPNVSDAIARLLTSIPHLLVLALLGIVSGLVSLIAAVAVVLNESYPENLWRFQRNLMAWMARVLAYHASLVDTYPPFSIEPDSPALTSGN